MDSYREHPSDFEPGVASEPAAVSDPALEIGSDERRMHVRAYNYWVSLLDGRDFPSIEDLDPGSVSDFADHSVLLDFTAGREDPATPYIGAAVREECGLEGEIKSIADVPSRSLLSRLTDHYMQIIANRAPVGFEAEFVNQRNEEICYRGILMPFSSDGDTIDFIYGVINWKRVPAQTAESSFAPTLAPAGIADPDDALDELHLTEPLTPSEVSLAADDMDHSAERPTSAPADEPAPAAVHFSWEDGPLHDPDSDLSMDEVELAPDAGVADRLWAARESADAVKAADGRSRAALYRALARAYDFALAAEAEPDDYAELLEESGVKAQARAPMTPVVKLVFGIDYDKSRLTEFAAALSFARRNDVESGAFLAFIEGEAGGLKALVAAERLARRPGPREDSKGEAAKAKMRQARPIELASVDPSSEFALVLARRCVDGGIEPVALVEDPSMVERALRKVAR